MKKQIFTRLLITALTFSILSCQAVRQNDKSANASSDEKASTNNSQNQTQNDQTVSAKTPEAQDSKNVGVSEPDYQNGERKNIPATDSSGKVENRCGWFSNPTPANMWLEDKDGEWLIGAQGGYQAEGDTPEFDDDQWVKTNINYGYGCACLRVTVDRKEMRILKIVSATAKPLSACRNDKALKEPT